MRQSIMASDQGRYKYSDKVWTPTFRGSFAFIFKARETKNNDGSITKKFAITCAFPKGTDISALKKAAADAARKMWGDKAEAMLKNPKFRSPFRKGEDQVTREGQMYAGFEAGQDVIAMTSTKQPGLVDAQARYIMDDEGRTRVSAKGEPEVYEVVATNAAYSGCWFRATCQAQAYDRSDGFGVAFKLENLQLIRQDEKLGGGGRASADADFAPVEQPGSGDGSASGLFD
jgi:hypothetical protein